MTQVTTTRNSAHIGSDFPQDELWEMFHTLHDDVLRFVAHSDDVGVIDEFCEATKHWRLPVEFQFNALYLFAEKHGLIKSVTDGLE